MITHTQSNAVSEGFTIKGGRDGLLITIDEGGDWTEITGVLVAHIEAQSAFFKGARVAVDVQGREVRSAALSALRGALSEREVSLWAVVSEHPDTAEAAKLLGLETSLEPPEAYEELEPIDTEIGGSGGVLVRQTLRSGATVQHPGHVVVIGDVNPGAEIVAGGDVVVWGRLRGVVSAGAYGDEKAVVCALDLAPTQLRIAGHIAISPPNDRRRKPKPEIAAVRDGQIIASPWKPGR